MSSDIVLNDGESRDWVTIDGSVLVHRGSDLMIDSPSRRSSAHGFRRAIVHTADDGLAINFNGDYPGGVTLNNLLRLKLKPISVLGRFRLPADGSPGDVIMVHYTRNVFMPTFVTSEEAVPGGSSNPGSEEEEYSEPWIDIHGVEIIDSPVEDGSHTLWVCVGTNEQDRALWSQIPLGEPVTGG